MAAVYRATDLRLERSVAIKVIHPHLAEQPDFVSRFIREARSAARLSSPYIVSVYDQGVAATPGGERPYLVMELINGPDLRSQLRDHGSLPLGTALEVTRQVLQALAESHANDIVHRDVKPENILLVNELNISSLSSEQTVHAKVADFGLARAVSDATHTSNMLGTVGYAAPEMITEGSAGPASDIYSTGIMLYELIAGALPFTGETPLSVAYKHVNLPVPSLVDKAEWIPPAIDSVISLFTAKDPTKRPQNGAAALTALEDVIASIPTDESIRRIPVFPDIVRQHTESGITPGATTALPDPDVNETSVLDATAYDSAQALASFTPGAELASYEPAQVGAPYDATATAEDSDSLPPLTLSTDGDSYYHDTPVALPEDDDVPRRPRWKIVLIVAAIVLALTGFGLWFFLAGPGMRTAVPDVSGMTLKEATAELEQVGFTVESEERFSDTVKKGKVVETDPPAGASVHPSSTITVYISKGVEMLEVPDVVGKESQEAEQQLRSARFEVNLVEEYSETVPEGIVVSQDPAGGETVRHDTVAKVVVSKGREPLELPALTGKTIAEATSILKEMGLALTTAEEYSDSVAKGTVISQTPAPQTVLYRGDQVNLVVSKGPTPIAVPDVFGMQREQAIKVLQESGFKVSEEKLLGGVFGTVRSQTPGGGEMAQPGTTVVIRVI